MWIETKIEKLFKTELEKLNDELDINPFITNYTVIKQYLVDEIYSEISKIEPNLSDHGEKHIQNVLANAHDLIKEYINEPLDFSPLELYVLCLSILVHDIGNIEGREKHEKKINQIFNRKKLPTVDPEHIRLITTIASKHGGKGNTISTLNSRDHIEGKSINSKEIAAIVRFADELAEGPQRASKYLLENKHLNAESEPYHKYAKILKKPRITKDSIFLTYTITLEEYSTLEIQDLLKIICKRIHKLNNERIYCGHYCKYISYIKNVIVDIIFFENLDSYEKIDINNKLTNFELSNLDCTDVNDSNCSNKINEIISLLEKKISTDKNIDSSIEPSIEKENIKKIGIFQKTYNYIFK